MIQNGTGHLITMPCLSSSNEKILVTGASGFIAAWLVRTLLEKGYTIRGTVRSESKGQYLRQLFAEFGDRFEYVIVKDIADASFITRFTLIQSRLNGFAGRCF